MSGEVRKKEVIPTILKSIIIVALANAPLLHHRISRSTNYQIITLTNKHIIVDLRV